MLACTPPVANVPLLHHGTFLTFHDLGLLNTASLHGVKGASKDGNSQRDLLVARNGGVDGQAASLTLHVEDGATVTFGTDTDTTKRDKARSARLAAALEVQAANSGLKLQERGHGLFVKIS